MKALSPFAGIIPLVCPDCTANCTSAAPAEIFWGALSNSGPTVRLYSERTEINPKTLTGDSHATVFGCCLPSGRLRPVRRNRRDYRAHTCAQPRNDCCRREEVRLRPFPGRRRKNAPEAARRQGGRHRRAVRRDQGAHRRFFDSGNGQSGRGTRVGTQGSGDVPGGDRGARDSFPPGSESRARRKQVNNLLATAASEHAPFCTLLGCSEIRSTLWNEWRGR